MSFFIIVDDQWTWTREMIKKENPSKGWKQTKNRKYSFETILSGVKLVK